ncbi:CDIF630_02480 family spore surface protein [Dethiothermospora halolimnae]|uniref:CDIF630_02480 family spore surface protein n=1 Tax=Dethiothermospora halolimnae TaxID=3114390 RepID=UPI003CCB7C18
MAKNRYKQRKMEIPIENHKTAAWANIEKIKRVSRVPIPSLLEVENAKEYVEENQK